MISGSGSATETPLEREIDHKNLDLSMREPPYFYLSTLQSSTATFNSCYANFTASNEHNLVLKYDNMCNCKYFYASFLAKEQK